ncbi:MAG: hypothetical protein KC613_19970 [Myxococcales bacterium]|nr:hypothetical protein [Myxococcales bacterium]
MTALPGPIAHLDAPPRLTGPALPVLLGLTFDEAEAAALLEHATADELALETRTGAVCRELARVWSAGLGGAALIEAAVWDRLAPHARRYRDLSLAEVADFWRVERAHVGRRDAAALIWYALLQGGLCGRQIAEQMADDCLFSGLRR